jgi:Na+/H+-translocating membrane pyrophosphatase
MKTPNQTTLTEQLIVIVIATFFTAIVLFLHPELVNNVFFVLPLCIGFITLIGSIFMRIVIKLNIN